MVVEGLAAAESNDDVALVHREMEFAAAERLMFFSDAAVPITANLIKPFLRGRHAKMA